MSHTPGPWTVGERGNVGQFDILGPNDPKGFRTVVASWVIESNTRLIAAAPDMLAALQSLNDFWIEGFPGGPEVPDFSEKYPGSRLSPDTVKIWSTIRAAIAKATGKEVVG